MYKHILFVDGVHVREIRSNTTAPELIITNRITLVVKQVITSMISPNVFKNYFTIL